MEGCCGSRPVFEGLIGEGADITSVVAVRNGKQVK